MKRVFLCAALAATVLTAGFAQGISPRGPAQPGSSPQNLEKPDKQEKLEKTSVSGVLGVARGMIALTSGEQVYYVAGLDRFIGFIDGLKEGAEASLEGYAFPLPGDKQGSILRLTKLSLNGKDYDMSQPIGPGPDRQLFGNNAGPTDDQRDPPPNRWGSRNKNRKRGSR